MRFKSPPHCAGARAAAECALVQSQVDSKRTFGFLRLGFRGPLRLCVAHALGKAHDVGVKGALQIVATLCWRARCSRVRARTVASRFEAHLCALAIGMSRSAASMRRTRAGQGA